MKEGLTNNISSADNECYTGIWDSPLKMAEFFATGGSKIEHVDMEDIKIVGINNRLGDGGGVFFEVYLKSIKHDENGRPIEGVLRFSASGLCLAESFVVTQGEKRISWYRSQGEECKEMQELVNMAGRAALFELFGNEIDKGWEDYNHDQDLEKES